MHLDGDTPLKNASCARYIVIGVIAILSQPAAAYICRDEKGSTSYQEDPCPERKGTSGVTPVTANDITDKGMQETVKRLAKTAQTRDSAAAITLMSRDIKVTMTRDGKTAKPLDYPKYLSHIKSTYDGVEWNRSYKCKPGTASSPSRGALVCDVNSQGVAGTKRMKAQDKETIEFALEAGEIKIVSIEVNNISHSEEGRF